MVKGRSGTSSKLAHVVNAFFVAVIAVSICVLTHTASAHVLPSIVIHPHRDASFTPYDALEPETAFRDAGLFQDTLLGLHSAASKTSFTLEDRAAVRRELQYLLERFAEEEIRRGSLNKRSPSIDLSGMFAGLTLGYFSLDETALAVLAQTGTPKQRRAAEKILPVRKDGHLLLTTLLVANMIFNECLPIIIDQVLPPVPAVALAIVLVIIFAEVSQLHAGSQSVP
ncbi:Predicted membrane protein, contains two CBS domains [Ceraceosorus bombacis]|uniref:Predicted membrane protein, contains two CBS domains n=1 Tax=Ceraceosorus bombacis TaxID=401625 RepID=A0A0P1BJ66_9BASI|nr:Predicted membrane protein, contains two CBS domains [Ceraceosorus bombacis]